MRQKQGCGDQVARGGPGGRGRPIISQSGQAQGPARTRVTRGPGPAARSSLHSQVVLRYASSSRFLPLPPSSFLFHSPHFSPSLLICPSLSSSLLLSPLLLFFGMFHKLPQPPGLAEEAPAWLAPSKTAPPLTALCLLPDRGDKQYISSKYLKQPRVEEKPANLLT